MGEMKPVGWVNRNSLAAIIEDGLCGSVWMSPHSCPDEDVPLYALSPSDMAEIASLRSEVERLTGELGRANDTLVRAWNAFGAPPFNGIFDVDDLEHLPRTADGDLDEQIKTLEASLSASQAREAGLREALERIRLAATVSSLSKLGLENALAAIRGLALATLKAGEAGS